MSFNNKNTWFKPKSKSYYGGSKAYMTKNANDESAHTSAYERKSLRKDESDKINKMEKQIEKPVNDSEKTESDKQVIQVSEKTSICGSTPKYYPTFSNHKDRISLGIACCRFNGNKPEILLVRKRYTYSFNIFGHGKYNSGSNAELINLFNGMTVDEKLDILSLNFKQIWYRLWLHGGSTNANYLVSRNKFESTFVIDGGARLKKLISKSSNVISPVWEIPKGRKKNKQEPDIHCAIREFYEETGIPKKNYKIFPWATRTQSYVDSGVRYTSTYYLAYTKHNIEPRVDFGL
jgi:hypothetical protein